MLVGEKLFSYRWKTKKHGAVGGGRNTRQSRVAERTLLGLLGDFFFFSPKPELCFIPGQTAAYFFETKLKIGLKKNNLLSCILKHAWRSWSNGEVSVGKNQVGKKLMGQFSNWKLFKKILSCKLKICIRNSAKKPEAWVEGFVSCCLLTRAMWSAGSETYKHLQFSEANRTWNKCSFLTKLRQQGCSK